MGMNNVPEAHRDSIEWRDLLNRVRAIEQRPFHVPELDDDPDPDGQTNLWMLSDGRLRWRDHQGDVWQATGAVTGATTSSDPLPVDPDPNQFVNEYEASWTASYLSTGVQVTTDELRHGSLSGSGAEHSMFGLDYVGIAGDLLGAEVVRTELFLNVLVANSPTVAISIGTHDNTGAPVTWDNVVAYKISSKTWPRGGFGWNVISNSIAEAIRDGTATGIILDPRSDNTGYYASVAGITGVGYLPVLRVTYVK